MQQINSKLRQFIDNIRDFICLIPLLISVVIHVLLLLIDHIILFFGGEQTAKLIKEIYDK